MNEQNEYPLNEKLLEEAIHLIERWRMIKDRREKVEEYKTQVSGTVFDRVKADYAERLQQAATDLLEKKIEVDSEIDVMQQAFDRAAKQLEEQKHTLEETDLRHKLGEFSENDHKSTSTELREKIDKLTEIVASIQEGINRYESLFEEVDLSSTGKKPSIKEAPKPKGADPEGTSELQIDEASESVPEESSPDEPDNTDLHTQSETIQDLGDELDIDEPQELEHDSAEPASTAQIVMIAGEEAGATFTLTATTSIGRAESSTIRINDSRVSRQHSRIQRHGEEYIIVDLHSSNGTYVNGQKIDEYVLAPGDEVQIGDTILQFHA